MRNTAALACAVLLAIAVGGCSKQISGLREATEGGFQKPMNLFTTPEWARTSTAHVELGPRGPVAPTDLVSADGQCAPAETTSAAAPAPAPAPAQTAAASGGTGFNGGLQAGGPGTGAAPVATGGIALGMTECEAVRRAGTPSNVTIGAGEGGERKVVVSYLSGQWPGIYTFSGGRLKVIDAAPVAEKKKSTPKKKKRAKSASSAGRVYVQ